MTTRAAPSAAMADTTVPFVASVSGSVLSDLSLLPFCNAGTGSTKVMPQFPWSIGDIARAVAVAICGWIQAEGGGGFGLGGAGICAGGKPSAQGMYTSFHALGSPARAAPNAAVRQH